MTRHSLPAALIILAAAAAGCNAVTPAAAPAPTAAPSVAAAAPAAPSIAPSAAASANASPSAVPTEVLDGTIQSVTAGNVALSTGRSFTLPTTARVQRSVSITAADLQPGQYVAVTAKRQPDNTLLASIVNIFPPSLGQVAPGQRPLPEGNLMTNANIDQVEGNTFTVSFAGGGARVQLAPDARITRLVDATSADLVPGTTVTAQVDDGAARSVTIQPAAGSPQPAASPAT